MASLEVGRICVKTSGREALRRCVLVEIIDKNFALVTGPKEISGIRRRRVNLSHLEPTDDKIDLKKNASDEKVMDALKKANLVDKMKKKLALD
ncbi:50S ribosomal protein L14e [Candidatus Bathyarchaeota archaeon]|nr:50S ribosomal protein L14e [Candidatus Bathyarchaeota archaeon]